MKTVVCTIIAKNYLGQAELFAQSYKLVHPDHEIVVLFIDNLAENRPNFRSINVSELGISNFAHLAFKYNILELSTAAKPFLLEFLIKSSDADKVFYFDPDIYVYKPITRLLSALDTHDVVLTPHISEPARDAYKPDEWDYVRSGYYNLGFVGFTVNSRVRRYLRWWQSKLRAYCYSDPDNFMFTDQKWMDFAPSYLHAYIVYEKGYNVAYWNLHQYLGQYNPADITFFHFSGFNYEKKVISKYQDRYSFTNVGEYLPLYDQYGKELKVRNKQNGTAHYSYPFGSFTNGIKIGDADRRVYSEIARDSSIASAINQDLFDSEKQNSLFEYLLKEHKQSGIINFFYYLFHTYDEIQSQFPALVFSRSSGQIRLYAQWCVTFAPREYKVHQVFVEKQKQMLKTLNISGLESLFKLLLANVGKKQELEQYIRTSYLLVLQRRVDPHGLAKNLEDIHAGRSSKYLLSYKLLSSWECRHNGNVARTYRVMLTWVFLCFHLLFKLSIDPQRLFPKLFTSPDGVEFEWALGMNIFGYFDTESGVAESARGIVEACDKVKLPSNLLVIEQPWLRRSHKRLKPRFTSKNNHKLNLYCVNADQSSAVIEKAFDYSFWRNRYNIGYWYWESDLFPNEYAENQKFFNEIWVATQFVYSAVQRKVIKPVLVIPPSFSRSRTHPAQSREPRDPKAPYTFLNIFDSASFWQRKNPFGLIEAFRNAFSPRENVQLIIKTTRIKETDIYPKLQKSIGRDKRIKLVDGYVSQQELNKLQLNSDAYISLHAAEGLGIPFIEMMRMEKPVIGTNYGGNTDFMSEKNSFLVDYDEWQLERDIGPYEKGSTWAKPKIESAIEQMQKAYFDRDESARKAKMGKQYVDDYFDPKRIGKLIIDRLNVIQKVM